MSTLHEWHADPVGHKLIEEAFGKAAFNDAHIVKLIGSMPMDTLAGFGFGLTHAGLASLVETWEARTSG